jgi:hypothetical protein
LSNSSDYFGAFYKSRLIFQSVFGIKKRSIF